MTPNIRVSNAATGLKGYIVWFYPPTFEPTAVGAGTYFAAPVAANCFVAMANDNGTFSIATLNNLTRI